MQALVFTVAESSLHPLWDYGWLDRTDFDVAGAAGTDVAVDVVAAFLRSPIARRSFCDPGPWGESVGRHGPFLPAALDPEWLRPTSALELRAAVAATTHDSRFATPPTTEQLAPVEEWLAATIDRGDSIFAFDPPHRPDLRVDFADMTWWVYRGEFLTVSRTLDRISVAVLGYD